MATQDFQRPERRTDVGKLTKIPMPREYYEALLEEDPRVQALARVIMTSETGKQTPEQALWLAAYGKTIPEQYRGQRHPALMMPVAERKKYYRSTTRRDANGKLRTLWHFATGPKQFGLETTRELNEAGFLLNWQDVNEHTIAALARLDQRGGLEPFLQGDIDTTFKALRTEWEIFDRQDQGWSPTKLGAAVSDSLEAIRGNPTTAVPPQASAGRQRAEVPMASKQDRFTLPKPAAIQQPGSPTELPAVRSLDKRIQEAQTLLEPQMQEVETRLQEIYSKLQEEGRPRQTSEAGSPSYSPSFWTKLGAGLRRSGGEIQQGYATAEELRQRATLESRRIQAEEENARQNRRTALIGDASRIALGVLEQKSNLVRQALSDMEAEERMRSSASIGGGGGRGGSGGADALSLQDRFTLTQQWQATPAAQSVGRLVSDLTRGAIPVAADSQIAAEYLKTLDPKISKQLESNFETAKAANGGQAPMISVPIDPFKMTPAVIAEYDRQFDMARTDIQNSGMPFEIQQEQFQTLVNAYETAQKIIGGRLSQAQNALRSVSGPTQGQTDDVYRPDVYDYGHPAYGGARSYEEAMEIFRANRSGLRAEVYPRGEGDDPKARLRTESAYLPKPVKADAFTMADQEAAVAQRVAAAGQAVRSFLMYNEALTQPPGSLPEFGMQVPEQLAPADRVGPRVIPQTTGAPGSPLTGSELQSFRDVLKKSSRPTPRFIPASKSQP